MDTFVEQFASSRKPERDSQHLNTIRQGSRESLREYIARFNKEKVSISNPNTETVINAFRNGLHYGSNLCKELTKFPCKNFEDVLAKAWAQIRWDEDEQYKLSISMPVRTDRESRDSPNRNEGRNFRTRRMPKRIYDSYGSQLVGVLKGMGEAVKWPQKMKSTPGTRDNKRWCEFHRDHGHRTDECHALRLEVIINFCLDESNYANDPHDDALVISLSIANCLTKRILVDNGSSKNVLFLNAYREMGLKEADITRRCISLVGFSGESRTTIG
ncbi:hypothetical protein UlMin_011759 [Ulmus minor]